MPDPSTTTSQITLVLSGYQFQLLTPYSVGQPLGVAEAGLLNREWSAAVRTGFLPRIKSSLEQNPGGLTHAQIAALQLDFQHYADEFSFKALSQTRNSDPLLRQVHSIAKRVLDIRLNSLGQTKKSYGEHKYESVLARIMNKPEIISQAEQQLAATREAADQLAGMEQD